MGRTQPWTQASNTRAAVQHHNTQHSSSLRIGARQTTRRIQASQDRQQAVAIKPGCEPAAVNATRRTQAVAQKARVSGFRCGHEASLALIVNFI